MATEFDFSAVSVETAELPEITRPRAEQPNPFAAPLADSYSTKTGRAVTLPKSQVPAAERMLRRAADKMNIGCRIVRASKDGKSMTAEDFEKAGDQRQIRLMFQGQDRRNYTPRKSKNETSEKSVAPAN